MAKHGDKLLFDIGANVGAYAQARWETGEYAKIICIEANEIAFKRLETRFKNNNNIFPIFCAAGAKDNEKIIFYQTKATVLSTANPAWLNTPGYRFEGNSTASIVSEIEILSVTIDKLIDIYGIPDLVKIDVEGYEETVIKGLSIKIPELCFEWAEEMSKECLATLKQLKSKGFTNFAIQYNDDYTYKPEKYLKISKFKSKMLSTRKDDWGMIWVS